LWLLGSFVDVLTTEPTGDLQVIRNPYLKDFFGGRLMCGLDVELQLSSVHEAPVALAATVGRSLRGSLDLLPVLLEHVIKDEHFVGRFKRARLAANSLQLNGQLLDGNCRSLLLEGDQDKFVSARSRLGPVSLMATQRTR